MSGTTQPVQNPPGFQGSFGPPSTFGPPQSPPNTGPVATTTTVPIGPATTVPKPPTTPPSQAAPFVCDVNVVLSSGNGYPSVTVNVVSAARPGAWIVVTWVSSKAEAGVQLKTGSGSVTFAAVTPEMPTVEVYVDNLKRRDQLGCSA